MTEKRKRIGVRTYKYVVPFNDKDGMFADFLHSDEVEADMYAKTGPMAGDRKTTTFDKPAKTYVPEEVTKESKKRCHDSLEKKIPLMIKEGFIPLNKKGKPLSWKVINDVKKYKSKFIDKVRIINASTARWEFD